MTNETSNKPEILAPAGCKASFLAAIAAGADAIYCGLKIFSARMEADNFSTDELAHLTALAHSKGIRVYVALNTLVKEDELEKAGRQLSRLAENVKPDAVIVQDLAFPELAKQAGFKGEIHLSTLAALTNRSGIKMAEKLGIGRVVLPRELNVDEIKAMASETGEKTDLEVFIHGALCYAVSGKCYWSSFLGGKSGLRGRCVQPCRRSYKQGSQISGVFSCQDFSADVLTKILSQIPKVKTWKIEGRKKGPHYVYYTTTAYKMLRDEGKDAAIKRSALQLLEQALGRDTTHYNLLPQRAQNPINTRYQTASGKYVGKVQGSMKAPYFLTRIPLMPNDLLRIGYEDAHGHKIQRITRSIPKQGRFAFSANSKTGLPVPGSPVFLIDRRERALEQMIKKLEHELSEIASNISTKQEPPDFRLSKPSKPTSRTASFEMRFRGTHAPSAVNSRWLSKQEIDRTPRSECSKTWWWTSPAIWPEAESDFESTLKEASEKGCANFVLNSIWQMEAVRKICGTKAKIWAGPFCNISNSYAIKVLEKLGFEGVIVSPELPGEIMTALPSVSPLPLGVVISALWPLAISRIKADDLKPDQAFSSPKGEEAFITMKDSNWWVFPNWKLDISSKKQILEKSGYRAFIYMDEKLPGSMKLKTREGLWNWDIRLL